MGVVCKRCRGPWNLDILGDLVREAKHEVGFVFNIIVGFLTLGWYIPSKVCAKPKKWGDDGDDGGGKGPSEEDLKRVLQALTTMGYNSPSGPTVKVLTLGGGPQPTTPPNKIN